MTSAPRSDSSLRSRLARFSASAARQVKSPNLLHRFPGLGQLDDDLNDCVWLRDHVVLSPKYCIKMSAPNTRFLVRNEAKMLAMLQGDPSVTRLVASFEECGNHVLVTERLGGYDLTRRFSLSNEERFIFHRDSSRLCQVLGVETITHRDITPWNLRIDNGRMYLLDFEFATVAGHEIRAGNEAEQSHLDRCLKELGGQFAATNNEAGFRNVLRYMDDNGSRRWLDHARNQAKRVIRI